MGSVALRVASGNVAVGVVAVALKLSLVEVVTAALRLVKVKSSCSHMRSVLNTKSSIWSQQLGHRQTFR